MNDINILNDKNTMYHEEKEEKNGTFSSYYRYETDYRESAAASTLIGNNVILEAGNDANVRASKEYNNRSKCKCRIYTGSVGKHNK